MKLHDSIFPVPLLIGSGGGGGGSGNLENAFLKGYLTFISSFNK